MAHFIAIIDPSAERRVQFSQRAQRQLASFYGSPAQSFEHAGLAMVSWRQSWEPFHYAGSELGRSFTWGHAMERGQAILQRPDLVKLWSAVPSRMPPPLEGLHTALLYRADGSWTMGADLLGLMPVYYYCGDDYIIVGSSPELFGAHPCFQLRLSGAGLAGVLLTNGLVDGLTLLQGVRRLAPGRLLHAETRSAPRELPQYAPEISDRYFGASFEENFKRLEEVLEDCFARHLSPNRSYGLILSGGMDSRLVAGIVRRQDIPVTAFSFGSTTDIEVKCAVAAAQASRIDQRIIPVHMDRYLEYAEQECKWRHLSNGFSSLMFYEPISEAAQLEGGMLSGFAMDHTIGGSWSGNEADTSAFESFFKKLNRWGIPAQTIKRLLANSYGSEVVDTALERLKQSFEEHPGREFQKAWLSTHYHRLRFHVSGVLGLHARWSWPVAPHIDSKLLDLMGGIPYAHIRDRRLQYHLLKLRFPQLARAPLDRNSFNMKPVVSPYGRVINHLLYKPRELFYRWTSGLRERRFYYRAMDFNSPGWQTVRAAAEAHRKKALQIFDEATLAEILPAPDTRVMVRDGIIDTAKMKLMTGFLLWSEKYL